MNSSGIFSLAGFAYQIKVFIYYLSSVKESSSIGFETFDDVALQPNDTSENKTEQENKLSLYNGLLTEDSGISAIQIKHTRLSSDDYEKVLFNWIILESSATTIEKYILFVDQKYGNTDSVFPEDYNKLYQKIVTSNLASTALISKVKKIIDNDYKRFYSLCQSINKKYKFEESLNIDDKISKAYESLFNKGGVEERTYNLRICELAKNINNDILTTILSGQPYSCSYEELRHKIESICQNIRDDYYMPPSFSQFKKATNVDIKSKEILSSRQYIQLTKCKLQESRIKEYLIFEEYYNSYKLRNLENLNNDIIGDIEEVTHGNFEMTKDELYATNNDIPICRLNGTLGKDNSYAPNTHIRQGSAIHLTKSGTDKSLIISWEDE